jgi:hypothetical protein
MKKYAALFCRSDSAYKKRESWDVYDAERDARSFKGGIPCVCHPPCRKWGVLSHMAHNARPGEKRLALWSIVQVRRNGGIIEHPSGSKLFKKHLPDSGHLPDEFGGFTIEIDQFDFGHVAHKKTKLYICGIGFKDLPVLPSKRLDHTDRSICGNVPGTTRCTQYQREYTPDALIDWFERVLDLVTFNHVGWGV